MQMPARSPAATAADRRDARLALRRPCAARARYVGPTGGRGLARPGLGQAAHAHARVRRHRPDDPPPRGAARAPRRALRHPVQRRRRDRARQAAEDHPPPAARRSADLPRRDRAEERRARRGDRRRLAADLLLARALRGVHGPMLEEGFARRGGRPEGWDLAPLVPVVVADDVAAAATSSSRCSRSTSAAWARGARTSTPARRAVRLRGGRGHRSRTTILAGRKNEASAAVPDALVDEIALVGDRARIADRLAALASAGVTTLVLQARQPEALRLLAELAA